MTLEFLVELGAMLCLYVEIIVFNDIATVIFFETSVASTPLGSSLKDGNPKLPGLASRSFANLRLIVTGDGKEAMLSGRSFASC